MAVNSRGRSELIMPKKYQERETSPRRTRIWIEPKSKTTARNVPVIYYLSRNGQLEHPHFMEVPLSTPEGLYLRDVIHRLSYLRGKGMASMCSWSSKRSYKNGFVWHDLSENDFIHPYHGHEYVLKGSQLLETSLSFRSYETVSPESQPETNNSGEGSRFPATIRTRNQSWSSFDSREYRVYKTTKPAGDLAGKSEADAATQTGDERRQRETAAEEDEGLYGRATSELSREEISPPPSSCSTENLQPVG
ncbi:hypothetical protein L1049_011884 [Liquidambar formosana]|uniref:SOSEKI DIX-like domain-containing protein n=1 Tax=Liquidambar formosana TaxID=63359 RepID=A0AAP0RT35_LIQFO